MIGLSIGIGFTKFIGGGGTPPVHTPQTYALVGNSLFNFGLDHSVTSILAGFAHPTDTVVQQITFNQNLTTNWNAPAGRTTGIDVKAYLASDSADFLGLVDLPGLNNTTYDLAPVIADWWGQADNEAARGTFYQTWYPVADFDTTPNWVLWHAMIVFLRPYHNKVVHDVRALSGGPVVLLAPVADVLSAVYDAIDASAVDADFTDFWHDGLHPSQLGCYVIALTHWAVMHQQSPVGLPWSFSPAIPDLDGPLAAALQAIVWSVVDADVYAQPGTWPADVIPGAFTEGMWEATPGDAQISVTIDDIPDGATDIEYDLLGAETWVSSGGVISFVISSGVTNNVEYPLRIRGANSVGGGFPSEPKPVTPASSATVPGKFADGNWQATPITDAIAFGGFTLPTDGGSAITRVERRLNGGGAVSFGNTTGGNAAGLTRFSSYDTEIRAVNDVGEGEWSNVKTRLVPGQCNITASLFDFGGGDGLRGVGFSPWALTWGSKDREPIPGLVLIGAYTFTVSGETYVAFQGDQRSLLNGMSVYIGATEHSGTWVYNASSDYGVPATILVSAASPITNGVHDMQIRAAS